MTPDNSPGKVIIINSGAKPELTRDEDAIMLREGVSHGEREMDHYEVVQRKTPRAQPNEYTPAGHGHRALED